ncbi:hypothetical protein PV327_011043, partial [Microctonus hyperodae]
NNEKSVAKYALVEFIEERTDNGKISIECVPSSWVKFDKKIGKRSVKFLTQPYGPEDIRMIHDLIKKCAPTPQIWPRFPIILKGDAGKYLKVFKTDSETRGTEKYRNITQKFKDKSERDLLNTSNSSSCNSDSKYITHKNRRGKKKKRFEVISQHHSKDRNNNFGFTGNSKQKSAINSSRNSDNSAGVGNVSTMSNRNIAISTDPNITAKSVQNHNNSEEKGVEGYIDNAEMPDLTHMNRDLVCLYVAIKKLSLQIATMDQNQQLMINTLELPQLTSNSIISTSTFFMKHNFLKIETVDEFEILESNPDEDPEYLNDYVKGCFGMLKLILQSHTNDGSAVTERIFYSALSRCLTDSKDWDGNRVNWSILPTVPIQEQ